MKEKIKKFMIDIKMLGFYLLTSPFFAFNKMVVNTGKKMSKPNWLVYFFISLAILFYILDMRSKQNLFMVCAVLAKIYAIIVDGRFRRVYRETRDEILINKRGK